MAAEANAQFATTQREKDARRRGRYVGFIVVIVAVILLFPVYWMLVTSLVPTSVMLTRDPALLPDLSSLSFGAFWEILVDEPVARWLWNSALITLGSAVAATFVSALGGYSLSRFKTRGHGAMG